MTTLARRSLLASASAALLGAGASASRAQTAYPSRPVRIIVPWPAGGGVDALARTIQPALSERLSQTIVIENIDGGAGRIGTQAASRATPDGYTLLLANDTFAATESLPVAGAPALRHALVPVTLVISAPQGFFTHPRSGLRTVQDFADAARARPGALNVGVPGIGSSQHLTSELLLRAAGDLRVEYVPYRGGGPLLQDLVAGTIDVGVTTFAAGAQLARAGQLVPLVVTSAARLRLFPEVPTAAETIAPRFVQTTWMGLFAPAGTPAGVIDRVHAATTSMLGDPGVRERLATLGFEPAGLDPVGFAQLFAETIAAFADIAAVRGLVAGG